MVNYLTTSTGDVWSSWTSTTNTTTTNSVWGWWTAYSTTTINVIWGEWAETREQKQAARKQAIQDRRKQREIADRAKRLLFTLLNEDEQSEFRRYGSVRVVGERNLYEIGESNDLVTVLDKAGNPQHNLCLHPPFSYPKPDRLAATLLALRFNEAETVRLGNKCPLSNSDRARIVVRRGHRAA